ncbi:hypothetical protein [Mammaliicoccus sciuri]|uniref:hypothetical protein n=1 Tax=Mammaliicoccus sciuri TaxID=1296 RepID=UPI000D1DA944|nr:hypothetical protein [Mammaliicoccus sciuri]PTJ52495.1 hypothetical protein BU012_04685 [Mammaliicoccus sciuri]
MKFKELQEILNDEHTLYIEIEGSYLAVNKERGKYIVETNGVYTMHDLTTNDIFNIDIEPIEIIGKLEVEKNTDYTENMIRYALKKQSFDKVPKPQFVFKKNTRKTYYWLSSQFKEKG